MSLPKEKAWFAAKRYGYGWSLPLRWQGWVVLALFMAALVAAIPFSRGHAAGFMGFMASWGGTLLAVCAWKGEPAKWRWGEDDARR